MWNRRRSLSKKKKQETFPPLVADCIETITNRGLFVEGIFRISGSAAQLKELQKTYAKGKGDLVNTDPTINIHTVSGLLKNYFRDSANPLFTFENYHEFLNIISVNENERVEYLRDKISQLPTLNQEILHWLVVLLNRVAEHSAENKMDIPNLATLFGPILLRPAGEQSPNDMLNDMQAITIVMMTLLKNYPQIFPNWPDDRREKPAAPQNASNLTENLTVNCGNSNRILTFDDLAVKSFRDSQKLRQEGPASKLNLRRSFSGSSLLKQASHPKISNSPSDVTRRSVRFIHDSDSEEELSFEGLLPLPYWSQQ